MNILIRGANVLLFENEEAVIKEADIAIEDGIIKSVGSVDEQFIAEKTIEANGMIAMPGLINTHTHIPMSLLRNYADDMAFWEWLQEKVWPIEAKMNEEDIYWGSMLSISELIMSGTTCFNDMYRFAGTVAKAMADTGIRGAVSNTLFDMTRNEDNGFEKAIEIHKQWHGASNGRISTFISPHAPYTCSDDYLKGAAETAKRLGVPLHTHISESAREVEESVRDFGKSPVKRLYDIGVFDTHTMAAHCVHLSNEDMDMMSEKGVSVLNNPTSNLKLGNGFAPVPKLMEKGVNVSLGTDGACSNNNQDMFEEINLAAIVNKGVTGDPLAVPSKTAVKMATLNGAKAMGIVSSIGSIEEGKKADLILIDTEKPHFYPKYNLISSLSYCAKASDVDTVIVDGNILMEKRMLTTIDIEMVKRKVNESVKRLMRSI